MGEETGVPVQVIIALAVIAVSIVIGIKAWPVIKDFGATLIARAADIFLSGGGSSAG